MTDRGTSPDPTAEGTGRLPENPPCPFCERTETELANAFGPHASVASYWCRRCRSPFEFMRWTSGGPGGGMGGEGDSAAG